MELPLSPTWSQLYDFLQARKDEMCVALWFTHVCAYVEVTSYIRTPSID